MTVKLTDEQVYKHLLDYFDEEYNLKYIGFKMEIGLRYKEPLDHTFWAIMCSTDGKTFIEFSEVSESVFTQLYPAATYSTSKRERGWHFLYSQSYTREEMKALLVKNTRQGIISDLLLDIENEVA